MVEALAARDEDAFATALGDGGIDVLPDDAARAGYAHIEEILGPLLLNDPARLDDAALAAAGGQALNRIGALMDIAAKGTPQPADIWPGRALGQATARSPRSRRKRSGWRSRWTL